MAQCFQVGQPGGEVFFERLPLARAHVIQLLHGLRHGALQERTKLFKLFRSHLGAAIGDEPGNAQQGHQVRLGGGSKLLLQNLVSLQIRSQELPVNLQFRPLPNH